ncbi:MAG TPA: ATP-binding protein [Methanothermobacter sp.]|nr:AAA+ class ATPase with chaperone activity [Methanothermobacter sp. MT-2]HHW05278.1 ATP-binding protein [Methanothermobacter sp.]HOL69025.1 ATP-binding protein [Methanothermobacter sp.]HPU36855.1 ATP-binding protein [Methanothermobacter sp.]
MDYYHDEKMQRFFEALKRPKSLDEIDLSRKFIEDLILKIIATYGTIKVKDMHEITGLHVNILEECLRHMEDDELCASIGGGFLFPSVTYAIKMKGRKLAEKLLKENPYIGLAPVRYELYFKVMEKQLEGRFPIKIPDKIIEKAFEDVVGSEKAKEILVNAATIGKGFFIYGPPGTGKTFITSKLSNLLPPLLIPRYIEFNEQVIQLYDPDFHRLSREQPEDPRWVKVYAPFVFTGSELTIRKLETNFNKNKGVYETSPIIKANGGVLLLDDLGRQKEDHNMLLNRLIIPLENRKEMVYIKGVPVAIHAHFIPVFSTNLDISIMDEAHLRRAPLHIFLQAPPIDEIIEVFRRNLDLIGEEYEEDVFERFRLLYTPKDKGGEGLNPTFAHAKDLAQIAQAVRINRGKDKIDVEILEEALNKHVLINLQRMNIDIAELHEQLRTFRIKTPQLKEAKRLLLAYGAVGVGFEGDSILADFEATITPTQLIEYLNNNSVDVEKIDIITETKRELRKIILSTGASS